MTDDDLDKVNAAINTMLADPESELSQALARGAKGLCLTYFINSYFKNQSDVTDAEEEGES